MTRPPRSRSLTETTCVAKGRDTGGGRGFRSADPMGDPDEKCSDHILGGEMRFWGKAILLIALMGSTAVLVASGPSVTYRSTSNPFSVGCYDGLDQSAATTIIAITSASEGLSAAEVCAREWREVQKHDVSENLATCVVDGGGTGVFPAPWGLSNEEACAAIGAAMPQYGAVYGGLSANEVRALSRYIGDRYTATWPSGKTCRGAGFLDNVATDALQDHGLNAWTVTNATTDAGQRCAHFEIDPLEARVTLIDGN